MSTTVRDITPKPTGEKPVIIVVGEDGSLSVEPETMEQLLNTPGSSAPIHIMRLKSETKGSGVNVSVEPLVVDSHSNQRVDFSVWKSDHYYTPLLPDTDENVIHEVQVSESLGSTEDLFAALSEVVEPIKTTPSKKIEILKIEDFTPKPIVQIEKSVDAKHDNLTIEERIFGRKEIESKSSDLDFEARIETSTIQKCAIKNDETIANETAKTNEEIEKDSLLETINKSFSDIFDEPKTIKPNDNPRQSVVKPTELKSPVSQKKIERKRPTKIISINPSDKKVTADKPKPTAKPAELSDVDSESDFENESDEPTDSDSEFEADKPDQMRFKSKFMKNFSSRKRKVTKKLEVKDPVKVNVPETTNKRPTPIARTQSTPRRREKKPEIITTPVESKPPAGFIALGKELAKDPATPTKITETVLKLEQKIKKKTPKPDVFDDGIALFSTPDVIKRVNSSDEKSAEKVEAIKKPDAKIEPINLPTDVTMDASLDVLDLPEEFLEQEVAKLAENPLVQKVIDKTLNSLGLEPDHLDPALLSLSESLVLPDKIIANDEPIKDVSKLNEIVAKNDTTKSIEVVRPDGRIVVIHPPEKPATRSSKRKQNNESLIAAPETKRDVAATSPSKKLTKNDKQSDSGEDNEDDPNRLWCICKQPHNNRFMICCDVCEEWFHGQCVGVSKALGRQMELMGQEWKCPNCDTDKKQLQQALTEASKIPLSPTYSDPSSKTSKPSPRCMVCKGPSRSGSVYCSEKCIVQHSNTVERVIVFDRRSGKCLSGANAPTLANLKEWLKANPSFEVVSSENKALTQSKLPFAKITDLTLKSGSKKPLVQKTLSQDSFYGNKREPVVRQYSQATLKSPPLSGVKSAAPVAKTTPTPPTQPKPVVKTIPDVKVTPKRRVEKRETDKEEKPSPNARAPEELRENVKKTLAEHFMLRLKVQEEIKMSEEEVKNLSTEIEEALFNVFNKDTGLKYRNKYRSLIFNIKDAKNETLWRRICQKNVSPNELVKLSPEELASQELTQWRERENKHQIEMIKKNEMDMLKNSTKVVLKSHKGEEVIEQKPTISTIIPELDGPLNEEVTSSQTSKSSTSPLRTNPIKSKPNSSNAHSSSGHGKKRDKSHSRDRSRHRKDKDGPVEGKSKGSRSRDRRRDESKDKRSNHRSKSDHSSRSSSRHRSESKRHRESGEKKSQSRHDRKRPTKTYSRSKRDELNDEKKEKDPYAGLDKKSKEILESLTGDKSLAVGYEPENKETHEQESESDHEPTSTVTINTPPRLVSDTPKDTFYATTEYATEKETKDVTADVTKKPKPAKTTSADGPAIWGGCLNMADVGKFRVTLREVSGDCKDLILPDSLEVIGRIWPDTVWDYLDKMKRSMGKQISIVRLTPENQAEQAPYQQFYKYLNSRERFGVVKTEGALFIKDFYIMPQPSNSPLPPILMPMSGPGFEASRPNLLLGIIISSNRKRESYDTTTVVASKKLKGSSPPTTTRSYTPPPTPGNPTNPPVVQTYTTTTLPPLPRDPRIKLPPPPLPAVPAPKVLPPPLPKVLPPPPPDVAETSDLANSDDEPYSPGDSDTELPDLNIKVMKSTKSDSTSSDKHLPPKPESKTSISAFTSALTDLSVLEPFKTSKFSSIPGLDTIEPDECDDVTYTPSDTIASLFKPASTERVIDLTENLSQNRAVELGKEELERKMQDIEREIKQREEEVENIAKGLITKVATTTEVSASLVGINLPTNIRQILENFKPATVTNDVDDDEDDLQSESKLNDDDDDEEYNPELATFGDTSEIVSSESNESEVEEAKKMEAKEPEVKPKPMFTTYNVTSFKDNAQSTKKLIQSVAEETIPLLLPKRSMRSDNKDKPGSSDLTMPLNLPLRHAAKRKVDETNVDLCDIALPPERKTAKVDDADKVSSDDEPYDPAELLDGQTHSKVVSYKPSKVSSKSSSGTDENFSE